ncbi:cytochrome c oxidase subunit II [Salirhabdus salicampi]|uniref:cytochrome c oxidase subunit II n=1 Tax=Salirhabdus salicampi TaxID=476102 RepID=UPI0020C29ADC|nr:cytochrome c oxidase subunit II [Salirhabdus salicampi]MCP8616643.1 cytochrome c oxidase subunit II [Salirhabdus salicampi]
MKGWMGRFRALFLVSGLALLLSGCGKPYLSALQPKGEGSEMIYDLMLLSIGIMVFVFVVVMVIYTIVLVRFRQKKGQEDFIPKQTEGSHLLETLWTVIPIILLLILAVPTVQYTFALSDTTPTTEEGNVDEDALWIEVTGNQYWWHFNYQNLDIQTSQDLYIPTDQRVYLTMKSNDVIHSFWVPSISGKMDTNPGAGDNEMFLHAYQEGIYWGKCAELCGPSHSIMDFKVIAVSPGEFDQWVEDMQNVNVAADEDTLSPTAAEGKELFEENSCIACHAIGSSPSAVGPNVTNFGQRTTIAGVIEYNEENLIEWILNPEKFKPGNRMTNNYPMPSYEEAEKIAEYLMTLKPSDIGPESAEDGVYLKAKDKEEDTTETEDTEETEEETDDTENEEESENNTEE